jgi:Polysaccharide lyase
MPKTSTWTRERPYNRQRASAVLVLGLALILAQLALAGPAAARTDLSKARTAAGAAGAQQAPAVQRRAAAEKTRSRIKANKNHKRTKDHKRVSAKHTVKRSKKSGSAEASSASGSARGTVLFDGSAISSWALNQSATPTRVLSVPDPSGAAGTVQQFTTYNTDVAPLTPTNNPRSQLCTPQLLKAGQQYWESFEVYAKTTFTFAKTGWLYLETAAYGEPFAGTPPATISIEKGAFRFQRNSIGANAYQVAWTTPVVKGQWYRFTWHFDLSASGWVELYVNDVQQPLQDGKTQVMRLPLAMLDRTDSSGPWFSDEQVYFQHGAYQSASMDFKNYKIGTTQAAAES